MRINWKDAWQLTAEIIARLNSAGINTKPLSDSDLTDLSTRIYGCDGFTWSDHSQKWITDRAYVPSQALRIAAEEAYRAEVIEPEMEKITIGENGDYNTKEEWIEDRISDWLERAKLSN